VWYLVTLQMNKLTITVSDFAVRESRLTIREFAIILVVSPLDLRWINRSCYPSQNQTERRRWYERTRIFFCSPLLSTTAGVTSFSWGTRKCNSHAPFQTHPSRVSSPDSMHGRKSDEKIRPSIIKFFRDPRKQTLIGHLLFFLPPPFSALSQCFRHSRKKFLSF